MLCINSGKLTEAFFYYSANSDIFLAYLSFFKSSWELKVYGAPLQYITNSGFLNSLSSLIE